MQRELSIVDHKGGCHCRKVRFDFKTYDRGDVLMCNCSMCSKLGYLHLIVEKDWFNLLTSDTELERYTFNTGTAKHYFCKTCGVKSFYIPRSHPDKISVNVRCIDPGTFTPANIIPFDGQNWEKAYKKIKGSI